MKSSYQISVDFQNAQDQARKLEDAASRLERNVLRQMDTAEQGIHSAWKGQSATLFLSKEERLSGDIRRTASDLRGIASDIRRIARRIYDAEMEALRIAQSRRDG